MTPLNINDVNDVPVVPNSEGDDHFLAMRDGNPDYLIRISVSDLISDELATVAVSGDYNDLSNVPDLQGILSATEYSQYTNNRVDGDVRIRATQGFGEEMSLEFKAAYGNEFVQELYGDLSGWVFRFREYDGLESDGVVVGDNFSIISGNGVLLRGADGVSEINTQSGNVTLRATNTAFNKNSYLILDEDSGVPDLNQANLYLICSKGIGLTPEGDYSLNYLNNSYVQKIYADHRINGKTTSLIDALNANAGPGAAEDGHFMIFDDTADEYTLIGKPSQGEAEAGTENTKPMTALRVAQAIAALAGGGGGGVQNNYTANADPSVNDDANGGFAPGSVWINQTSDESFRCSDSTIGAAVWINTSLTSDELATVAVSGDYDNLINKPTLGNLAALNTVGEAQIDDESVTLAKMQHVATARILGRDTPGVGDIEELTASAVTSMLGLDNSIKSDTSVVSGSVQINNIIKVTQAQYDGIGAPDANTIYIIEG